jgi:hypothetical protein
MAGCSLTQKPVVNNSTSTQPVSSSQEQANNLDANVSSTTLNKNEELEDFSINYIFDQDFVFKNYLSSDCVKNHYGRFENVYRDMNLLREGEIFIPNLKELINSVSENDILLAEYCHDYELEFFSYDYEKQIIFLNLSFYFQNDAPYSGLSGLYKLDLRTKSISSLPLSASILSKVDASRGSAKDVTYILPDNKRVIKWDKSNIYLVNLEEDRVEILYTAPSSTWLISELSFEMGYGASYNVRIQENNILVGLYDKQIDNNGKPIELNEFDGEIEPNLSEEEWGKTVSPRFIKNVVVPIPAD